MFVYIKAWVVLVPCRPHCVFPIMNPLKGESNTVNHDILGQQQVITLERI